jgi:hypothetical protein
VLEVPEIDVTKLETLLKNFPIVGKFRNYPCDVLPVFVGCKLEWHIL